MDNNKKKSKSNYFNYFLFIKFQILFLRIEEKYIAQCLIDQERYILISKYNYYLFLI